jgi:hypothetical protein
VNASDIRDNLPSVPPVLGMRKQSDSFLKLRDDCPGFDRWQKTRSMQFAVECILRSEIGPEYNSKFWLNLAQGIFEREGYPEKLGWIEKEKARQLPQLIQDDLELKALNDRLRKPDDVGDKIPKLRTILFLMLVTQFKPYSDQEAFEMVMDERQ